MSSERPLPIRVAQTLGITSSLMLSGLTISTSLTTIPRLLESPPSLLLQQWGNMYKRGAKIGPPVSLLASTSFFYLAYKAHVSPSLFDGISNGTNIAASSSSSLPNKVVAYILAGVLSIGIVPYTFAVLMPTNKELLRKVEVLGKVELSGEEEAEMKEAERSAHQLVDWWGVLNLGRGVMLAVSGVVGVWTSLG
ncbi:hypothetical protein ONS95_011983 [Cadophora gregata]|uniref:uncharacterized protein n=1 Tax=Cadophora gregata TaxID=51156 RepID=UPI0026DC9D22|nr:uncharacterized protein ONS95_011983 [Cadophora gregata]KAK0117651.1 hypothetical protein ONS95_011983 [Cadophora gregata]KAK0122701.1 hypothetical protein ONS96_009736 [Cadophora gregata f. sp. sojae]